MINVATVPAAHPETPTPCMGCGLPGCHIVSIHDEPARKARIDQAHKNIRAVVDNMSSIAMLTGHATVLLEQRQRELGELLDRPDGVSFKLCGECTWKLSSALSLFAKQWEADRPKRAGKRRR